MSDVLHDELQAQQRALELAVRAFEDDPVAAAESARRISKRVLELADVPELSQLRNRAESVAAAPVPGRDHVSRLLEALRSLRSSSAAGVILVVDDDQVSGRMLEAKLSGIGRQVKLVGSVAEAEQTLAVENVAVVLLDLFLPDGDGRGVLMELRSKKETAQVPVIVLSGNASPLAKSECIALGANAYVEKPFDPDSLVGTVNAHLLRSEPSAGHEPAHDGEPRWSGPRRVLLAEDDRISAALVVHRLERDGFEVVHREDGPSALAEADRERFGVLVLDVKLPGMDGFEILATLRDRGDETPVVMVTGMGREEDVVRAFDMGANDYVLKPFSPGELSARVSRLVGAA